MKPQRILALFVTSFFSVLLFFHLVNAQIPTLSNGSALPDDIQKQTYAITGYEMKENPSGVTITFSGMLPDSPLALTMADMGPYTLYVNGTELYSYQEQSMFSRFHYIVLPSGLADEDGYLDIFFQSASWGQRTAEILTGRLNAPPKLLIGPVSTASVAYNASNALLYFLCGMCMLLILNSILMFFCRPHEVSFLFLAMVTLTRLITMMVNIPDSLLSLPMRSYYLIRPMLVTCPVVFHAAMGIYLLHDALSVKEQRFFSVATITALTAAAVFLQHLSSRNWYHLIQLLCFLLFFHTAWRACVKNIQGAPLLLAGYAASAAVILYVYLVNVWRIAPAGLLLTTVSITHFSYMFSLLSCSAVIHIRLMEKFRMAEHLSQELTSANQLLDQRVEERTRELRETQAQKQTMMLNIFHDLRNPVFVLRASLQKLSAETNSQAHYKALAETRLSQLAQLIEDLFLAEKLESGKLLMNEDHVSMSKLMETTADSARLMAPPGASVFLAIESDCYVWGDSLRLLQAFQNLAENALAHISEDGWLRLSLSQEDGRAVCVFADNGCGIAPENLPHIFDRYYTSNRRDKSTSTGLGLSIAYELILAHGGSIDVASKLSQGSVFTVTLPCTEPPALSETDCEENDL